MAALWPRVPERVGVKCFETSVKVDTRTYRFVIFKYYTLDLNVVYIWNTNVKVVLWETFLNSNNKLKSIKSMTKSLRNKYIKQTTHSRPLFTYWDPSWDGLQVFIKAEQTLPTNVINQTDSSFPTILIFPMWMLLAITE